MAYTARTLRAAGTREVADRVLKSYELVAPGHVVDTDVRSAAGAIMSELVAAPVDESTPAAGWSVLHRGEDAAYVLVYSWVWREVLEVRLAVAGMPSLGAGGTGITDFGVLDKPWAGCVWELAPLTHERKAWIDRVLRPTTPDVDGYLRDFLPDGEY